MDKPKRTLLIIEDEELTGSSYINRLNNLDLGLEITWIKSSSEAKDHIENRTRSNQPEYGLIVLDIGLKAHFANVDAHEGIELLKAIRALNCKSPVIVSTGRETVYGDLSLPTIKEALGIVYIHIKGSDHWAQEALIDAIRKILSPPEYIELPDPEFYDKLNTKAGVISVVGATPQLRRVFSFLIPAMAASEEPVLIRGEGGTGKEAVSRLIHERSKKSKGPFVAINCATISPELVESELFGHKKGAFTGAISDKEGYFKVASEGTIFLDEIAELTLATQAKLLRVLEQREFTPVGAERPEKTYARIICATNRLLEEMVAKNEFRSDLFYRISVLPVILPTLRERGKKEIDMLIKHFLNQQKNVSGIDEEALEALRNYSYPGNVRELRNLIHRLSILASGEGIIRLRHLPPEIQGSPSSDGDLLFEHLKVIAQLVFKNSWITMHFLESLLINIIKDMGGSANHLGISGDLFGRSLLGTKEDAFSYIRSLLEELADDNFSIEEVAKNKRVRYIRRKNEVIDKILFWVKYVENILHEPIEKAIIKIGTERKISAASIQDILRGQN